MTHKKARWFRAGLPGLWAGTWGAALATGVSVRYCRAATQDKGIINPLNSKATPHSAPEYPLVLPRRSLLCSGACLRQQIKPYPKPIRTQRCPLNLVTHIGTVKVCPSRAEGERVPQQSPIADARLIRLGLVDRLTVCAYHKGGKALAMSKGKL